MASKKSKTSQKKDPVGSFKDLVLEAKNTQLKLIEISNALVKSARSTDEQNAVLTQNMNSLITRLDKIFSLFEEASKHVGDVETAEAKITDLSTRLEQLLEQNKTIAQGLILLEKYVRGKTRLEPTIQPKPLE